MDLKIKTFEQLTKQELYEILRLRMEVFIVEQGGRYQDLDQTDYTSTHIFVEDENQTIQGCIRLFEKKDEPHTIQLGRLATRTRNQGIGKLLMDEAEKVAQTQYRAQKLFLTGRHSALGFYLKCGYEVTSPQLGTPKSPYYTFEKNLLF